MTLRIVEDDPLSPQLASLLALHVGESRAVTPPQNAHVLDAEGLANERISFWTARDGDLVVGMAALRETAADHGEIKSMRTAPGHLRRGIGRLLLDHVLWVARERGYRRVSLETGTHAQFAAANRMYEHAGFIDGPVFGGYSDSPHNRFMTLEL